MGGKLGFGIALLLVAGSCGKDQLLRVDGLPVAGSELGFGQLPVGTTRTLDLHIVDDGRAPVRINTLEVTSGTQTFVAVAEGRVVDSVGGSTRVHVTFHPEVEGSFHDQLVIHTDSDSVPELRIRLTGSAGPADIVFDPPLLDFGGVETGDARTLGFDVVNPTDLPVALSAGGANELSVDSTVALPNSRTHHAATFRAGPTGRRAFNILGTPCPTCTAAALPTRADALESAIAMSPDPLTWSNVPVHHTADATAQLKNVSWREVHLDALSVDGVDFSVTSGPQGVQLPPGGSAPVTLRFAPQYPGQVVRTLTVDYHSFAARSGHGGLVGLGGGAQIAVTPLALDFGDLPVGGKAQLLLYVQNAGQNQTLELTRISDANEPFSATLPEPPTVAPGGTAATIAVDFEPTAPGDFSTTIEIHSNDPITPTVAVALQGSAHPAGPCTFELTPARLDFGNVPPGTGAVLGFRFSDSSSQECAVKDIQLDPRSSPAFFMPGGALVGGDLFPSDAFSAQVAFKSPGPGQYGGELVLTVNDPSNPHPRIPLVAHSSESCLVAAPPFIDFGAVRFECSAHDEGTLVTNACTGPITVTGVDIGAGTRPEFNLVTPPATPLTLQAGETFALGAQYAHTTLGQQYAPLFIHAAGEPQPLLVPLLAETLHVGVEFDRFVQGDPASADVLFVVSNTDTMGPYQQRLASAVGQLLDAAAAQGVNLHVGVTATGLAPVSQGAAACIGGAAGGEAGRLVPVDGSSPRIVTLQTPNDARVLARNVQVGTCQSLEQGLEAMLLALSPPLVDHADDTRTPVANDGNAGFLRPAARLAVVVLADEDDHSGFDPAAYVQFLRSLKGQGAEGRSSLYAIVPRSGACTTAGPPGDRFSTVAAATGGVVFDVCENDYGPLLAELAQRGLGAQTVFPLSAVPDGAGVTVKINGQPANGSDWYYDPNLNAIVFNPGFVPVSGSVIEADYTSACN